MPGPTFPPRALQTLRILWGTLTFSTVLLLVVLQYAQRPKVTPNPMLPPMLAVAALGVFVVGIVLPRHQLRLAQRRGHVPLALYNTAFLLGMALTESVALFGFVLAFQSFAPMIYLPFFVVAWIGFILRFPRDTHPIGFLGPAYGASE